METALRVATPAVADAGDLAYAERMLIWATRRVACGRGDLRIVEAEFLDACGEHDGPTAWIAFRSLLVLLAVYGRRPFVLGPPSWPGLTPDETSLLQVFAAAQAGDGARLASHLAWLVRHAPGADPGRLARVVAEALQGGGHPLRLRGR
jgi:hypothetical protein